MQISVERNSSLKNYNTFGVAAKAHYFVSFVHEEQLVNIFSEPVLKREKLLVLGGGSNMLFVNDFDGLVLHVNIQGIRHAVQHDRVIVSAGAGVVWNDLVWYCVDRGFAGIENLALIPGTTGAAPVQNIGAYGAELKDVFFSCRAFDRKNGNIIVFHKEDCGFAYRDSIFKNKEKGRYIITEVSLTLSLQPQVNITYGAISAELERKGIHKPGIRDIAEVVSHIRVSKLPDPSTIGNAGSFFKNPIIPVAFFEGLIQRFPEIVYYPAGDGYVKLAAGWLIEQCGWKGRQEGNAGTWKNQALVLVNHGGATGAEIFNLSEAIVNDVNNKFKVQLEREVNIID